MSIEIFDDDIEQLRDDLSVVPWNVISNDDVRNSCQLPIRISYEFVDMGDTDMVLIRISLTKILLSTLTA